MLKDSLFSWVQERNTQGCKKWNLKIFILQRIVKMDTSRAVAFWVNFEIWKKNVNHSCDTSERNIVEHWLSPAINGENWYWKI